MNQRTVNRKGSMQLGVEAIIILVIAIVLLGSILFFIRNFMGDTGNQLGTIIDGLESCSTQAGTPMLPTNHELKLGSINDGSLCVYNDAGKTIENAKVFISNCLDPTGQEVMFYGTEAPDPLPIQIGSLGTTLERDGGVQYVPKITVPNNEAYLGVWTCNVQVSQFSPGSAEDVGQPKIGPRQLTFDLS